MSSDLREEALRQAINTHAGQDASAATIVSTAEAFLAFLTSEAPSQEPSGRPLAVAA